MHTARRVQPVTLAFVCLSAAACGADGTGALDPGAARPSPSPSAAPAPWWRRLDAAELRVSLAPDDDVVVAARTTNPEGPSGVTTRRDVMPSIWVERRAPDGTLRWSRRIHDGRLAWVTVGSDGATYLMGSTVGPLRDGERVIELGDGPLEWVFLTAVAPDGAVRWTKAFHAPGWTAFARALAPYGRGAGRGGVAAVLGLEREWLHVFAPDGTLLIRRALDADVARPLAPMPTSYTLATAPSGALVVAAHSAYGLDLLHYAAPAEDGPLLSAPDWRRSFALREVPPSAEPVYLVAADVGFAGEDPVVVGAFPGTIELGGGALRASSRAAILVGFAARFAAADGAHVWSRALDEGVASKVVGFAATASGAQLDLRWDEDHVVDEVELAREFPVVAPLELATGTLGAPEPVSVYRVDHGARGDRVRIDGRGGRVTATPIDGRGLELSFGAFAPSSERREHLLVRF